MGKDEEITAIANRMIKEEYPLLACHYNSYDVRCIREATNEYENQQSEKGKNNSRVND